jgi:hypothetical protein
MTLPIFNQEETSIDRLIITHIQVLEEETLILVLVLHLHLILVMVAEPAIVVVVSSNW